MPKHDFDAMTKAIVEARVKYWRQWGVTVSFAPEHRARIEKAARAIRRGPEAAGRAMEKALLTIEAPYHAILKERRG